MDGPKHLQHARNRKDQRSLRILVVEDDTDTATSMAILLGIYGYDVEIAANGPAALEVAQLASPDVVLLDIGLPGMDGWQVAAHLRKMGAGKKRPLVIAITGYGEQLARLRSYEEGIDLHLVKPVSMDELQRILTRVQTVSMRSAQRFTARPTNVSRPSMGPLEMLSDCIRIEHRTRQLLVKAQRREELALRIEETLVCAQSQLSASQAHTRRVLAYLRQAN